MAARMGGGLFLIGCVGLETVESFVEHGTVVEHFTLDHFQFFPFGRDFSGDFNEILSAAPVFAFESSSFHKVDVRRSWLLAKGVVVAEGSLDRFANLDHFVHVYVIGNG